VAAIFASRLLNKQHPLIFEDGLQTRDFVHVSDVVAALELALVRDDVGDVALNVGTGQPTTVLGVARALSFELGIDLSPLLVNRFRRGDVRHCYADISRASSLLGYEPKVSFQAGMRELTSWIALEAPDADDRIQHATNELAARGLVV
jgi:dTDP-L-rhamnose 4-epimerase